MKTDAEIIQQYIAIRTHIAELKEKHKLELEPFQTGLETLEGAMAMRLMTAGASSVKTDFGTAYQVTLMKPKVVNRDAFLGYAVQSGDFSMFDIGCLLEPLKEYMAENNKALPPGIDVTTIVNTNFRKS